MNAQVLIGQVVSFRDEENCDHFEKGAVVISREGRISWCGNFADLAETDKALPITDYGQKLILPGFIDPHIHFPQYRMLAAPGRDLLDWLNRFTFPEEALYAQKAHAEAAAGLFLDALFRNGTTSALAFCSSHKSCADALFAAARSRRMALATGKTMMDENAPEAVRDTVETGVGECEQLIADWHGKDRLRYAITPRFAVTSSAAQLSAAGELLRQNPALLVQSHLSENRAEIEFVTNKFPAARDYTDIYDQHGLLGTTAIYAHGIHLSRRERARLAEAGTAIAHCPTSNTFLGSGLFDLQQATSENISVGLASDVGGGTSYSMLQTMAESYKVAMLKGYKPSAGQLYHMATLGNAKILHQDGETGSLEPGKWADMVVLDPAATPLLKARNALSESLEDVLFSLMILGDDRAVTATYIAGLKQKP